MPIKGLSDQLRLPRLGKIRLGEKKVSKKTGKEYPISLDYFVVPEEVKAVYGDKPRQLDVMFPTDDEEIIFPQHYKRYGKQKGLICKGDGEDAVRMTDDGRMQEIACPGKDCKYFQKGECRAIGNLHVWLWKVPGLGIYQIDTSSINSILNINGAIHTIKGIFGRIRWIPLVLTVQMQETHPLVEDKETGGHRRMATIVPVMNLTAQVSVEQLIKEVKEKEKKGELPAAPAEIINPDVDEKPELLYMKHKEGEDREEDIPQKEKEEEIQNLFKQLNYPPTRQRMLRQKYKSREKLIEHLTKELENARNEARKEEKYTQSQLFQD